MICVVCHCLITSNFHIGICCAFNVFVFILFTSRVWWAGTIFQFSNGHKIVATGVLIAMSGLESVVQNEIIASARTLSRPKQFWEQGWYGQIFGQSSQGNSIIETLTKRPWLEKLEPEGQQEYVPASSVSKPTDFVKQRLVLARLIQTDDVVRHGALRKLREIILQDLEMTGLGRSLKDHANRLAGEDILQSTFENAFTNKSIGTLAKRSSHLWQLNMWCYEMEIQSIIRLQESDLYQFLLGLKTSGRGATVGKQCLQSLNFLFHLADADGQQLAGLMTTRVKGVADSMMANKAQLKQAIPLTTDIVYALE